MPFSIATFGDRLRGGVRLFLIYNDKVRQYSMLFKLRVEQ
jgi:hypothetical protein